MTALYAFSALWALAVCACLQGSFIFVGRPGGKLEWLFTAIIVLGLLWAEMAIARVAWQVIVQTLTGSN